MEVWVELIMNFKEFFALQETNNDDMMAKVKLSPKQLGTKFRPVTINNEINPALAVIVSAFELSSTVKVGYATLKGEGETEYPTLKKKTLYVTGPSLRRHLLGVTNQTFQLATDATPSEIKLILKNPKFRFTEVQSPILNKNSNLPKETKGNYFYSSKFDKNDQEIQITAVVKHQKIKITTLNKNSKCDTDPPENTNFTTSIIEDAKGRCFTVDSMYIKLKTSEGENNELLDPIGGFRDLQDGKVKYINPDSKSVEEDPLSAFECCSLSAQIEKNNTISTENIDIISGTTDIYPDKKFTNKYRKDVKNLNVPTENYIQNLIESNLIQILFPNLRITKPHLNIPNDEIVVTAHLLSKNEPQKVMSELIKVGWDKSAVIKIGYLIKLSQWAKGEDQWHHEFIRSPIDIDHQMIFLFLKPFQKAEEFKKMIRNAGSPRF